jgi:hypothetical protein
MPESSGINLHLDAMSQMKEMKKQDRERQRSTPRKDNTNPTSKLSNSHTDFMPY